VETADNADKRLTPCFLLNQLSFTLFLICLYSCVQYFAVYNRVTSSPVGFCVFCWVQ
jgi:hypothetical protein